MIHFRIRDYISVLFYRMLSPFFGYFGRRVRVVHPLRIVGAKFVSIGDDVTIQHGAYIAALKIHDGAPHLKIGAGTKIGNYSHIICTRLIDIGENVLTADRLYIADNRHEYADVTRPVIDQGLAQLSDVRIGNGTWIGENVCIIGCSIGANCVIAANSVVTRDIPDHCVAAGAPAIPVQWLTDRGSAVDW